MEEPTTTSPPQEKSTAESAITLPNQEQAIKWLIEVAQVAVAHVQRQDKFEEVYSNNFHFELSAWDLKILFGQLEQHAGQGEVDWRTAITLGWAQAKILEYYLRANIAYREKLDGKIIVPRRVVPGLTEPTEEAKKSDPNAQALYEAYLKIHREVFGQE